MPTWDQQYALSSRGREIGRTFNFLQCSRLESVLIPINRNTRNKTPRPSPLDSPSTLHKLNEIIVVMKAYLLFLLCCTYLFLDRGVDAIQCYECNSHINSLCAEKVPPDALKKDCSEHMEGAKYTMCRKIVQTIEFSVNGLPANTRVIRNCGWDESNYKDKCYQRSGFGGRQEVCSCTTDLCNAAPGHIPTSRTLMILSLLSTFLVFARN